MNDQELTSSPEAGRETNFTDGSLTCARTKIRFDFGPRRPRLI